MNELAWSWAQLVNTQLHYLQYGNKVYQLSYLEKTYTNFPPQNSPIWNLMAYDMNSGFVNAMQQGFVVPK